MRWWEVILYEAMMEAGRQSSDESLDEDDEEALKKTLQRSSEVPSMKKPLGPDDKVLKKKPQIAAIRFLQADLAGSEMWVRHLTLKMPGILV